MGNEKWEMRKVQSPSWAEEHAPACALASISGRHGNGDARLRAGRVARPAARTGIYRGARGMAQRAWPWATPAHPTSARACPAFAGDAQLDGQRGGGNSSDALDAFRHLPRRERSSRGRARHEARRPASGGTARRRGNALEREATAAGRAEAAGCARDAPGAGAAWARAATSGSARRGDGGRRAGDDERDPAFAEATTTSTSDDPREIARATSARGETPLVNLQERRGDWDRLQALRTHVLPQQERCTREPHQRKIVAVWMMKTLSAGASATITVATTTPLAAGADVLFEDGGGVEVDTSAVSSQRNEDDVSSQVGPAADTAMGKDGPAAVSPAVNNDSAKSDEGGDGVESEPTRSRKGQDTTSSGAGCRQQGAREGRKRKSARAHEEPADHNTSSTTANGVEAPTA
ncbi:hypothetical protein K523DRAFT_359000 [Schizophyllum commune Tattone D]|nr:hypothetical protein K523DRAFT_359000 [Schizophyllum commune Tattone D]